MGGGEWGGRSGQEGPVPDVHEPALVTCQAMVSEDWIRLEFQKLVTVASFWSAHCLQCRSLEKHLRLLLLSQRGRDDSVSEVKVVEGREACCKVFVR